MGLKFLNYVLTISTSFILKFILIKNLLQIKDYLQKLY